MKKWSKQVQILSLLLIVLISLTGCGQKVEVVPGVQALEYLKTLDQMGGRIAGTEAETKAADWIESSLKEMGYTVERTPFDYEDSGTKKSQNIIAEKKGEGKGTIIVGAHYDSVDVGTGVDDNGSGVAVVLEAAKALQNVKTPHNIRFVFFGAEEVDILGSAYYTEQMTPEEISDVVLYINYDSLVAGDVANVYGNADDKGKFREHTLALAQKEALNLVTQDGIDKEFERGVTGPWSDHAPFEALGIPFIYFESTNWELGERDGYTQVDLSLGENGEVWHTEYDTFAYIEKTFPGRIAERLTLFSKVLQMLLIEDLSKI